MHAYGRDNKRTPYVHVALAIIAYLLYLLVALIPRIELWNFGGVLSVFSIFAALEVFFDRYLWKLSSRLGLIKVADFSGTFCGQVQFGDNGKYASATINITQTWSKILVEFEGVDARGQSFSASVIKDRERNGVSELIYNYNASHKTKSMRRQFDHKGTGVLEMGANGKTLLGEYYTEQSRDSHGTMAMKRQVKIATSSD